ncbi:MAG: ABC transporter permease, partial [Bacteroidota bacterium]
MERSIMDKLPLIIKREYLAKVRNKSFIIMTILSPILIVGMILLVAYLTKINDNEKRIIAVLNESTFFSGQFKITESTSYVQFQNISLQKAKDSTLSLGYFGLLHIPAGPTMEEAANAAYLFTKENPSTLVTERLERIFQNQLRQERLKG